MAFVMSSSLAFQGHAESMECWDDDPDFADLDIPQHHPSPTYSRASADFHRRESGSRMSMVSGFDLDGPEERHVPLDESPAAAIAAAARAGIPIPENVPSSALVGGTIRRLGTNVRGKKTSMQDDWGEDLELPSQGGDLTFKRQEFPDTLQQLLDGVKSRGTSPSRINLARPSADSQLCKFRDTDEDDDFFSDFQDLPALKRSPARKPLGLSRSMLLTPPLSESTPKDAPTPDDDFENDFDFPTDAPLQLKLKNERKPVAIAKPPSDAGFDDWGESDSGLGSSYPGSHQREPMYLGGHGSIISGLAPSISGLTVESEEENLEGLEFPDALPDLKQLLERRKESFDGLTQGFHAQKDLDDPDDEFFDGIDLGEGDLFDQKTLAFNRNVKHKPPARKRSPVRRTALSLTFTTNNSAPQRPPGPTQPPSPRHIRNRLSQGPTLLPPMEILEPVVERENRDPQEPQTQPTPRRSARSRWSSGGTTEHRWSGSDGPNAPPIPPIPQSRLERERATKKTPTQVLKNENKQPTTTSAQLLRAKRSMPNIAKATHGSPTRAPRAARPAGSPLPPPPSKRVPVTTRPSSRSSGGRPPSSGRPSSSTNSNGRPTSSGSRPPSAGGRPQSRSSTGRPQSRTDNRPKTPHANLKGFRHPAPFVPAGSSVQSSHHAVAKASRPEIDRRPTSRLIRTPPSNHSPSNSWASSATTIRRGSTPKIAPEQLRREAAAIGTLTQPTRKRNFGDGTELEAFDDLPTSARVENKFTVAPVARGGPRVGTPRGKGTASTPSDDSPKKKHSRISSGDVPSFARDTAASRNARELTQQRLGIGAPTATSSAERWKTQIAARGKAPLHHRKKSSLSLQQKPHLIKPMGNINNLPKETAANGMTYNPKTMKWDGNERDLTAFNEPAEDRTTPPRQPALISKVGHSGGKLGIQVVGGMVFDPTRMCWLKVDEGPEDEQDPFEGVEDIPEDIMSVDNQSVPGLPGGTGSIIMGGMSNFGGGSGGAGGGTTSRASGAFGEFVVGEEFDVGPQFVQRQREEEDRWRKRVDGWITADAGPKRENRWLLKELTEAPLAFPRILR